MAPKTPDWPTAFIRRWTLTSAITQAGIKLPVNPIQSACRKSPASAPSSGETDADVSNVSTFASVLWKRHMRLLKMALPDNGSAKRDTSSLLDRRWVRGSRQGLTSLYVSSLRLFQPSTPQTFTSSSQLFTKWNSTNSTSPHSEKASLLYRSGYIFLLFYQHSKKY